MPPSERREKMISIMRWLDACSKAKKSPRPLETKRYIELEIGEMGSTPRTIQKYLDRLKIHGLIKLHMGRIVVTTKGKTWLSLHTQ